jgi:hypothetical protein
MNFIAWTAVLILIAVLMYVMVEVKDWIDSSDNQ